MNQQDMFPELASLNARQIDALQWFCIAMRSCKMSMRDVAMRASVQLQLKVTEDIVEHLAYNFGDFDPMVQRLFWGMGE